MKTMAWLIVLVTLRLLVPAGICGAAEAPVNYITPEALHGMLGNPQLLIIDVRAPKSYAASDKMIKGAVRHDEASINTWGPQLPKDKTIVVYCS